MQSVLVIITKAITPGTSILFVKSFWSSSLDCDDQGLWADCDDMGLCADEVAGILCDRSGLLSSVLAQEYCVDNSVDKICGQNMECNPYTLTRNYYKNSFPETYCCHF